MSKMIYRKDGIFYDIRIDEEWYTLCVCNNCGDAHAESEMLLKHSMRCDNKIKCCKNPDNWYCDYPNPHPLIKAWIKKWELKTR